MIKITGLFKNFELPDGQILEIFQDTNLSLETGDFIALMGQSGQGKTTFLNMIAGLEGDYKGSIQVGNEKIESLSESEKTSFRGKHISYVFQDYNLIDTLTVQENIELVLDINKTQRRYETDEILEKVGLLSKKKSFPSELSGGEKQRVTLARAFISVTDIILADEPTGSLDENNATKIMDLFVKLWKESGVTIIMITHSSEIAQYASLHYELKDKMLTKI